MEFPSLKTIKIWSGFWSKLFHLQWISWNLKTIYIYIYTSLLLFKGRNWRTTLNQKSGGGSNAAWACPAKPNGWTMPDRWPKSGLRGMGLSEVEWTTQWFSTRSTIWKAERSFWRLAWTTWWRRFRWAASLAAATSATRHQCLAGIWRAPVDAQETNIRHSVPSFIAMT